MKYFRPLPLKTLPRRIWLSTHTLARFLYFKPRYLLVAIAISVVFYEIIFWSLNLGLLHFLVTSQFLTIGDKIGIFVGSYTEVFSFPLVPLATTLFVVSLLQGISIAALIYTVRQERRINRSFAKEFGSTGLAGILAGFGLGCAACGTSLVTPVLTFFFATSSIAIAEIVGLYSALLALVLSVVAAYLTGLKLAPRLNTSTK